LIVQLVSKISNLCDPDPPTSQTDGQTDRQTDRRTTCNLNTELCTSASRGKKYSKGIKKRFPTHVELHWLDVPGRVTYNIATMVSWSTHEFMAKLRSTWCIAVHGSPTSPLDAISATSGTICSPFNVIGSIHLRPSGVRRAAGTLKRRPCGRN